MSDATPTTSPRRGLPWLRFVIGLIAPLALPFLIFLILGTNMEPWMHSTAWMLLIVMGLVAGIQHRRWAFLAGVVISISAFLGFEILGDLGWLSW